MPDASETTSQPTEPAANENAIELLSFFVGEHEYSVDIMSVREIRGWSKTTSLPHSPPYVRGVINLRGTVLPVIDLALRLGLEAGEPDERNVVIVVDVSGRTLGMRVDAVSDILSIPLHELKPPPDIAANTAETFLKALTLVDDRMVRCLKSAPMGPIRLI
ncbi:MAG: chemotaxis protein CheW [Boseongicola sp.]|nr:MAG: chemotaxis protein CheW [Boseongicola sp.]